MATATLTRVDELRSFKEEVRQIDMKVDSEFQRVLSTAQRLLELSDGEIADALLVSRPSVNRWMNGASLPYNAMRKVVFSWVDSQLASRLRKIEAIERTQRSLSSAPAVALPYAAKSR